MTSEELKTDVGPEAVKTFRSVKYWQICVAAAVYFLVCLFIQWRSSANSAAFGTYPDEPAHYVGGLLIRDYLTSGMVQSPFVFAQEYYKQIPYFATGHWPPLFYCFEAVWILLFGPGRPALLMLIALCAVGSACLVFYAISRDVGILAGFCGGLLFFAVPEIQRQICTAMVDLPVTFSALAATIFAVRYLESRTWKDAIGFSVFSAAAFLTKYSAAYVCIIPLLGIIAMRRWRFFKSPTFWIQPAIVLGCIGPWLFYTSDLGRQSVELDFVGVPGHGRDGVLVRLGMFLQGLGATVPWPVWCVIAIGLAMWIFRPTRWNTMGVTFLLHVVGLLAFLTASLVLSDRRYFTPGVAALLIAGIGGWKWVKMYSAGFFSAAMVILTLLGLIVGFWSTPNLRANEFTATVKSVLASPQLEGASVFVPSDAEGPMIAEFAMRDPTRPKRRLIRPGKVLAVDNWFGASYRCLFQQPAQVQSLLTDLHVGAVILRANPSESEKPHEVLLRETIIKHPDLWRRVAKAGAVTGPYDVFEPVNLSGLSGIRR